MKHRVGLSLSASMYATWSFSLLALGAAGACDAGPGVYATIPPAGTAHDGGPGGNSGDASETGDDAGEPTGAGVNAVCSATQACRSGLICKSRKCEPCGCTGSGAACEISDECKSGSYCGPERTCAPVGTGEAGAVCKSDADCASGLRCDLVGLSAECQPEGTNDVGGDCTTSSDCYGGLVCTGGHCQGLPPVPDGGLSPIALPTPWAGEACVDVSGPTQAYFRVPRGNSSDGDFYRLPFPNDVRRTGGKVSLSNPNHPTPGSGLLGYDLVQRWISDVEATVDGFSAYPTVFFRFSAEMDISGSLKKKGVVRWLDITQPASPVELGSGWNASTARNAYICDNWMGVRPPDGAPLAPGHTYAVFVTTDALDSNGKTVLVSPDLTALLGGTAPSDATLAAEWPKYQPFRDWAAGANVAVSSILTAAVFTVGHPNAVASKLADAVAAATAPAATSWVDCATGPSPCAQATGDRACGTPDPAFDELHALISLPIFQQGTEPYLTPSDGGDFQLAADGTPQFQRTEQVCMALTVPKGVPMPAAGWPLVVYAHGTGGSFRSHVTEGVAKRLASVDDGAGGQMNVAVLGIDQVETGPRRGSSTDSPDNLFFNYANPAAAHGNPLQGAADQISLVRFVTGFDLPAATSPNGAEIKVGSIAFWGHSQGATEGGIAMPYTTGVTGAVLSGEGASLIDALLTKKNPVDIADVIPVALQDAPSNVGQFHPVLALLQNDLDRVDPLNYASILVLNPLAAANQKHVFQPYGQDDTYAPPITEQTFAEAAQLGEAAPPSGVTDDPFYSGTPLPVPAGGNVTVESVVITAVVRQYVPGSSYDGHFVVYDNAQAEADVDHFLADALSGKAPGVGR